MQEGLADERRNRFKLYLHCVMIVTSVVPPELPMELSLAVTNSLAALVKVPRANAERRCTKLASSDSCRSSPHFP